MSMQRAYQLYYGFRTSIRCVHSRRVHVVSKRICAYIYLICISLICIIEAVRLQHSRLLRVLPNAVREP